MTKQPASEQVIHVLVADGQTLVRKGVCALLASEPDIEIVGEAGTPVEVVALAERQHPDVILMDLMLVPGDGIGAIEHITARYPTGRILVLTTVGSDDKIFAAIKAGAIGFLLKDSAPDDVVRAIHEAYHGGAWLHPTIARRLLREISLPTQARSAGEALTEREMDVLRLVAHGCSNQQIADELTICEGTVRVHVSSILNKLQLANRTQAALYALRRGLATLDEA